MEVCEVCNKTRDKCACGPDCGHICSLDYGESYCPICFPAPPAPVTAKECREDAQMDENFMLLALDEAETAFIEGEVPVGAVLVRDNKIIASAHNTRETENDPTAHAEITALRAGALKVGSWRLSDATLYVTKEPCVMCAGAMVNARLGRIVYGCSDVRYGAVASQYRILSEKKLNHSVEVISGILENQCSDILKRFFGKLRDNPV